MRAILDRDIIIKLCRKNDVGVEIGSLPKGKIGLECLRFDGKKVVDLMDLDVMYVDKYKILHAIPLPGTQRVEMRYTDRKNLVNIDGRLRVRTAEETALRSENDTNNKIDAQRRQHYPDIGDQLDQILAYLETQSDQQDLPEGLQNIIDQWRDVKIRFPKE